MEYCIYISKLEILKKLEEALKTIPKPDGDKMSMLTLNEKVNQLSLNRVDALLKQKFGINPKTDYTRIYFGNETCDRLIPNQNDFEEAVRTIQNRGQAITYVTPYTGPEGLNKIEKNLERLNDSGNHEVVFNDWGVLQLIEKKFNNLEPVMGRLMVKSKRDTRFSKSDYSVHGYNLDRTDKVAKKQIETVLSSSIDIKDYVGFLEQKGIERVGMETIPYHEDVIKKQYKKNKSGLLFDLYWPWTYITSGRNCQVAAYTQPAGKIHPAGKNCYFQCREFEFSFNSDKDMLDSVQRGNAIWMNTTDMLEIFIKYDFDRLVFQPYIPI